MIIDGGNSNWNDSRARAERLAAKGIHFCDAGTSGGVWGLKNGYCLMVGGAPEAVEALRADLQDAGAGRRLRARRPGGRRPLRQDGPQRHRVRADAGLRRGLRDHEDLAVQARSPQHRRHLGPRLASCARGCSSCSSGARAGRRSSTPSRAGSRTRARAAGRCRRPSTRTCRRPSSRSRSADAVPLAAGRVVRREDPRRALRNQFGGHAVEEGRDRSTDNPFRAGLETEPNPAPCVFVIFGASGDLTRRKLLPALYNLAVSRLLPPGLSIVGFALTELDEDAFRKSMHDARRASSRGASPSTRRCGPTSRAACTTSRASSRTGELRRSCATKLEELDRTNGTRGNRIYYLAIPPSALPHGQRQPRRRRASSPSPTTRQATRASSSRSPSAATWPAATRSTPISTASSTSSRSSASTTTSARRPSRTSSRCASATPSSSRSGTATTSTTCRSPWPRTSASRGAASSTRRRGRRATSCRTTCCSCSWSRRWSRPSPSPPTRCATRR